MNKVSYCPSLLAEGFESYSPRGLKMLFGKGVVSPILDYRIEDFQVKNEIYDTIGKISVSGAQEKFPAIIDDGKIRLANENLAEMLILRWLPRATRMRTPGSDCPQ